MFKPRNTYKSTDSGIPLFFKLWFAFCAILALSIFALALYLLYTVAADPQGLGRFLGEIVQGYSSAFDLKEPQ